MIIQNRMVRAIRERLNQIGVEGVSTFEIADCSGYVVTPVPLFLSSVESFRTLAQSCRVAPERSLPQSSISFRRK